MIYPDFVREFSPIIQYFGKDHFPSIVLERMHAKVKEFDRQEMKQLCELLFDNCRFAPKIPDVIEMAGIVRGRHRPGVENITTDDGPRTPSVAKESLEKLKLVIATIKPMEKATK